jgi:uncharacterized C2H2 Zn-finger protein
MDSAKVVELKSVGLLRCPRCGEELNDGMESDGAGRR